MVSVPEGPHRHVRSSRCWRGARHHRTILHRGGRPGYVAMKRIGAHIALPGRRKAGAIGYLRTAQACVGHTESSAVDGVAADEIVARSHGDSAGVVCISIVQAAAAVEDIGVANERVMDIHVAVVGAAGPIPWAETLARSQWEPADAPPPDPAE